MARSTAPRLSTGSTPGSAMSTADACALGGAPNAVEPPEKILDAVESCVCASRPTTTSQRDRSALMPTPPCSKPRGVRTCQSLACW